VRRAALSDAMRQLQRTRHILIGRTPTLNRLGSPSLWKLPRAYMWKPALRASGRTDADRRNDELAPHRELPALINQGCISSSTALRIWMSTSCTEDRERQLRRPGGARRPVAARYIATRFRSPPGPPRLPDRVTASSASATEHWCDSSTALANSKAHCGQVEEDPPFWLLNSTE
jgi:hypothetical protein